MTPDLLAEYIFKVGLAIFGLVAIGCFVAAMFGFLDD